MKELTPNGYEYYKTLDTWGPLEAALIVQGLYLCLLDPDLVHGSIPPDEVRDVYEASKIAVDKGELPYIEEIRKKYDMGMTYSDMFFREDESFTHGYLIQFKGPDYVNWCKRKKIRIPKALDVRLDNKDNLVWKNDPEWDEDGAISYKSLNLLLSKNRTKKDRLRIDQKTKIACQEKAKSIWSEYQILDICHLKHHPEIVRISEAYCGKKTVHRWLSEVAPEKAKKKGEGQKN